MKIEYFMIELKDILKSYYCIWYFSENSEKDFLVKSNNKIAVFDYIESVILYASVNNIGLLDEKQHAIYDLNYIQDLVNGKTSHIDCSDILDFWNIVDAICNTLNIVFIGLEHRFDKLYDKLFRGCNTILNKEIYTPQWSKSEINQIKKLLTEFLLIISNVLKGARND